MKLKIFKIKTTEMLFFIALGIYLFLNILSTTFYWRYVPTFIYSGAMVLCWLLLFAQELTFGKYQIKTFIGVGIAILMIFIAFRSGTGIVQNTTAITLLFIIVARNIQFEKIVCYSFIEISITLALIVLSSLTGVIDNYVALIDGRKRAYLGFGYSLYAPGLFLNIVLLWVYWKKEKLTWKSIAVLVVVDYWIYKMTDSRLSFGLTLLGILLGVLLKSKPNFFDRKKILCLVMSTSYIWTFALSIYLTVMYGTQAWVSELDSILGGRLYYGKLSLMKYGFSFLGNKDIEWVGAGLDSFGNYVNKTYFYVDCLYIQVLQRYGAIFLGIFLLFFTVILFICWKRKEFYLMGILTIIAIDNMIIDASLSLYYNTFLLAIGTVLLTALKRRNKGVELSEK